MKITAIMLMVAIAVIDALNSAQFCCEPTWVPNRMNDVMKSAIATVIDTFGKLIISLKAISLSTITIRVDYFRDSFACFEKSVVVDWIKEE